MKNVLALLMLFFLSCNSVCAFDNFPVTSGSGVPTASHVVTSDDETGTLTNSRQLVDGTNTTVDTSTPGHIKVNASGGASSPFAPAGFANVSTFEGWQDLAISPDGKKAYVSGLLTSNGNGAIAQVDVATGSVTATVDLGAATEPQGLAVSPDNLSVYANDANNPTWWKIATTDMSVSHTATLARGAASTSHQQFDISPDGSIYAWVSELDAKLYMINTSTFAQTNQTMSHTAGNLTAVCFYNGSNSNVYVAHHSMGVVDLYAIGGAYTSSVSTGAAVTPAFNVMRSGIHNTFFIADSGTNHSVIIVASGTPSIWPLVNIGTSVAVNSVGEVDNYVVNNGSDFYILDSFKQVLSQPLALPKNLVDTGSSGIGVMSDASLRIFTIGGRLYPVVWSLPPAYAPTPYYASGWTGSGTLPGGGTVTITTAVATTSSIISVSPTGTANVLPPAVTTKSAGSFVVTGTGTGTFDWTILKP